MLLLAVDLSEGCCLPGVMGIFVIVQSSILSSSVSGGRERWVNEEFLLQEGYCVCVVVYRRQKEEREEANDVYIKCSLQEQF